MCICAGDTVNTASRMESTSFPSAIQVSQAVVDAADKADTFHPLGARKIKGKGDMPTWLYKVTCWALLTTPPAHIGPCTGPCPSHCQDLRQTFGHM